MRILAGPAAHGGPGWHRPSSEAPAWHGVIDLLGVNGLKRGPNGLQMIMMCELPSNAVIQASKARGKYVGICGRGPSDHPDLA